MSILRNKEETILISNYFDLDKFPKNNANTFSNEVSPIMQSYDSVSLRMLSLPITDANVKLDEKFLEKIPDTFKFPSMFNYLMIIEPYDGESEVLEIQNKIGAFNIDFIKSPYMMGDIFDTFNPKLDYNCYNSDFPNVNQSFNERSFSMIEYDHEILPPPFLRYNARNNGKIRYISLNDPEPYYKPSNVKELHNNVDTGALKLLQNTYETEFFIFTYDINIEKIPAEDTPEFGVNQIIYPPELEKDKDKFYQFVNYVEQRWRQKKIRMFDFSISNIKTHIKPNATIQRGTDIKGDNEQLFVHLNQLRGVRIANQNEPILGTMFFEKEKIINKRLTNYTSIPLSLPLYLKSDSVSRLDFELRNAIDEDNINLNQAGAVIMICKFFPIDGSQKEEN